MPKWAAIVVAMSNLFMLEIDFLRHHLRIFSVSLILKVIIAKINIKKCILIHL